MLNNLDTFLEKQAPIRKYTDFNLPPDFFVDQFYLGETALTNKEIGFSGNYITVLNSYIPYNLESFILYYNLDATPTMSIVSNQAININPKAFLVLPNLTYQVQFNKLYRTVSTSPLILTNNTWTFAYLSYLSTPILVILSRDIRPVQSESFKDDNYKIALQSVIPGVNSTATLKIGHGFSDLVKVGVQIDTAVNPVTIELKQRDELAQVYIDFTINPAVFPYHQIFTMPERISRELQITVNGGGGGETGTVLLDICLSKRG